MVGNLSRIGHGNVQPIRLEGAPGAHKRASKGYNGALGRCKEHTERHIGHKRVQGGCQVAHWGILSGWCGKTEFYFDNDVATK